MTLSKTSKVEIHLYCSNGWHGDLEAFIRPWAEAQLDDKELIFHKRKCPIQEDGSSCGVRAMINIQYVMIHGPVDISDYSDDFVETFRFVMLRRILDFAPR